MDKPHLLHEMVITFRNRFTPFVGMRVSYFSIYVTNFYEVRIPGFRILTHMINTLLSEWNGQKLIRTYYQSSVYIVNFQLCFHILLSSFIVCNSLCCYEFLLVSWHVHVFYQFLLVSQSLLGKIYIITIGRVSLMIVIFFNISVRIF